MSRPISLLTGMIEAEVISSGMPILILGIQEGEDATWAFSIDENGKFTWVDITNVETPWKYDFNVGPRGGWINEKEPYGAQDDSPDGGPGFPGSVSELDEFSEGDPLDEEGRQAAGGIGDLDTGEDK